MRNLSAAVLLALLAGGCTVDSNAPAREYPDADSPGARVLLQSCGGCHAAPLPSAHTAQSWPSVVFRMRQRMISKGLLSLADDDVTVLTAYLQRHAGAATP